MKLERLPEYVLPTVVTASGMLLAVVMGYFMGQGRVSYVAALVAGLTLGGLTLALRQYIWLLIPFAWPLAGNVPILPLPFSVRDIVIGTVFCAFFMLIALKVVRQKTNLDFADYLVLGLLVYLVTAYIRNPVGTNATGATRIGGRPYLTIAISFCAYFVLSRSYLSRHSPNLPIWGFLAANYAVGILSSIALKFPKALSILANFYSEVAGVEELNAAPGTFQSRHPDEARFVHLRSFGLPTIHAMIAFFRPITLINPFYFLRFTGLLVASFLQLLSGFRSNMFAAMAYFLISAFTGGGFRELAKVLGVGFIALGILLLGQGRLFNLPFPAQRALCFLPGLWNPVAVADAENSTQWRVDMWKEYLASNRYINNHLLGDGFGFSKRDLESANSFMAMTLGSNQETMMVTGNIHSGPLSAIRVVGYIGLVAFLVLLCIVARLGWRTIVRSRNTPFLAIALFVGVPAVYEPVGYVLIFGTFETGMSSALFTMGMIKMLNNSLDRYEERHAQSGAALEDRSSQESARRPSWELAGAESASRSR